MQGVYYGFQCLVLDQGQTIGQLCQHAQRATVDIGQVFQGAGDGSERAVSGINQRVQQLMDRIGHGATQQVVHHILNRGYDAGAAWRARGAAVATTEQAAQQPAFAGQASEQTAFTGDAAQQATFSSQATQQASVTAQQAAEHTVDDATDHATTQAAFTAQAIGQAADQL
ncbi:hypothetical protein, partial [Comamonas humi]